MLMSSQATRYAHQLLAARAESRQIPCLSSQQPLTIADGYDIAKSIHDIRVAQGEVPIGRKLGFTNRTIWPKYGVHEHIHAPIWGHVYDSTVRYATDNHGVQSLVGAVQPRIEPEIVFKLSKTPSPDATVEELAECIEWMAHAVEIVVCPFPNWQFEAADAIAAYCLHGTLIIGEQRRLAAPTQRHLAEVLTHASVSLSCNEGATLELRGAGFGSDVMENPLFALWHVNQLLREQSQFAPLTQGEIVTTGTWTDAYPIKAGQTWTTAFSGVSLPGLTISFV